MISASSTFEKILSASFWGMLSTIVTGSVQLMIVPLLIGSYGKVDYGLIMIAFSIFAYIRMLDFGMQSGSIRFGTMWLSTDNYKRVNSLFQTNIYFSGLMGLLNALILIWLGNNDANLFNLSSEQQLLFKWMMWMLAINIVLDWLSTVFIILFSVNHEIGWISKITIVKNIVFFIAIMYVITFNIPLTWYFLTYTISSMAQLLLFLAISYRIKILSAAYLKPKLYKNIFKEVFSYSFGIFSMRVFQISALYLRPILISIVAVESTIIVADYSIIQSICALVIAFAGVFSQILLPLTSKSLALGEHDKISQIVHTGTKYISIFLSYLIFILVINVEPLLELYVGSEYTHLSTWVIVALITLFGLHNSPVSSLIIAHGRLTPLIKFSAINTLFSLTLVILFTQKYGVGGAILSYLIYTVLQTGFIYIYYTTLVFELQSKIIFVKSFAIPVFVGGISAILSITLSQLMYIEANVVKILVNSSLFVAVYTSLCLGFIVRPKEVKGLFLKFYNNKI